MDQTVLLFATDRFLDGTLLLMMMDRHTNIPLVELKLAKRPWHLLLLQFLSCLTW